MKTIKVLECPCGEEVYENDYDIYNQSHDDLVFCINCGTPYNISQLEEKRIFEISEVR
jgi:hypothetical protein